MKPKHLLQWLSEPGQKKLHKEAVTLLLAIYGKIVATFYYTSYVIFVILTLPVVVCVYGREVYLLYLHEIELGEKPDSADKSLKQIIDKNIPKIMLYYSLTQVVLFVMVSMYSWIIGFSIPLHHIYIGIFISILIVHITLLPIGMKRY